MIDCGFNDYGLIALRTLFTRHYGSTHNVATYNYVLFFLLFSTTVL